MEVHLVRADLVVVGSLASDYQRIVADYERRLSRYVKLEVHELKAEPVQRGEAVVLRAEGERITTQLDRIAARGAGTTTLVALDPRGEQRTTEQLAERWLGAAHLVLLIGGTLGLTDELRARADDRIAFGRITLPHQLARVVATEQLYRSFRIARGEPYHF
ncbi:MAG: rRNA ((1915)-N(3))-methyltransferase RlmH [Thermoleophilia bacterium]|nr:rRNA ((1915)-N(3))-methyltransferase RlmH [Thermoleophilia bacterium]MCZ4497037.1 rRNA ((1915)-N(3))-methyltransferase RlmH [Thermoleophilia bacterium]